jgi:hypothetical protein
MKIAGIVAGLLVLALPGMTLDAAAKTAAKKPAVAAKPASDDPDSAVDIIGPPSQSALAAAGWRIIDDLVTGARLGLPSALVPKIAPARMGSRWTSRQGQIDIETFRLHEGALATLFDDEKKVRRRTVEHSTLTPDSFVMSGMQGLKRFIVRVQSSGGELRGVTILFDRATEGMMAPIAAAMANSYQGFPDPSAAPPPGLRRSVEYGTAIVVSGQGHLITSAQIADGCQAITIPGFGHAESVAADKANDIALLRVYGALDLLPATISRSLESPIRWPRPAAAWSRARRRMGAHKVSTRRQSLVSLARRRSMRKDASPAWWICSQPPLPAQAPSARRH